MKKHVKSLLFLLLCFLMGTGFGMSASAANPVKATLKPGITYTGYDITGDRRADTIRISHSYHASWFRYENLTINVNGKVIFSPDESYYDPTIQLWTLKNGQVMVYIYLAGDNGDGLCALYRYQNNSLVRVLDLTDIFKRGNHRTGEVTKVSGNTITVRLSVMSYSMALVQMDFKYKYSGGGLKLVSRQGNVVSTQSKKYMTLAKNMTFYKNSTTKKKSGTFTKGTKMKVQKCYIGSTVRFKVKTNKGKIGWINAHTRAIWPKGSQGGGIFRESIYAG